MKIVCSYIAKGIRKMYAYENITAYSLFLTAVDVSFSETAVTVMEGDSWIAVFQLPWMTGQLDSSVSTVRMHHCAGRCVCGYIESDMCTTDVYKCVWPPPQAPPPVCIALPSTQALPPVCIVLE